MRAVIQRVSEAKVTINERVRGAISAGLLVLVAVEEADTAEDIEWLSGKIVRLRIFDDENGVMNRSVQEINGEILLVSQFTLFASTNNVLATAVGINSFNPMFSMLYQAFCSWLRPWHKSGF